MDRNLSKGVIQESARAKARVIIQYLFNNREILDKAKSLWRLCFSRMTLVTFCFVLLALPLQAKSLLNVPAPEIESPGPWLNSQPLTLKELKGKVVLVDFWTYSCINCLRTLPFQKAWYERYKDNGFVIVGVHAPEFDFEKKTENVERALKRFGVTYPIVQDNKHLIWKRYANQYWPAHYLINREGQIVYTHFGEGKYDEMEKNIRTLLGVDGPLAKLPPALEKAGFGQTPETYLGIARGERFQSPPATGTPLSYKFPEKLDAHEWALQGIWQREAELDTAMEAGAALRLKFRGGKVFLVMGTHDSKPARVKILYNGTLATDKAGKDVKAGLLTVKDHRLYELLDLKGAEEGILEIQAIDPGVQVYAFTFGAS
jgi:thiol-disulfide isomerase/thioredoxin